MFSSAVLFAFSALMALSSVKEVIAAPFEMAVHARTGGPVPAAPRFVIYDDADGSSTLPDPSQIQGFNVFALSFLLSTGPQDKALQFTQLSAADQATVLSQYAEAGISVIVSAFGETEKPTTEGLDPAATANTMAAFVKQFNLAGIDVDYEDEDAMNKGDGGAETWLATFTQTLRKTLPQGQFILTHAPLAPWFSTDAPFKSGAYLTVDKTVGSMIDWYNVQFYNQGVDAYTTCDNLLNTAGSDFGFPNTAVFEIGTAGVDVNKLVIGKPGATTDATNGFVDPATLAQCVTQATAKGWNAGVMSFEFPGADTAWISTVRGTTFPL